MTPISREIDKVLIVLLGATGVGKTALSLKLAKSFNIPIISADSRQIYREIPIGTAAPSVEEQEAVPHYLIGEKSITEPYSASLFVEEATRLIEGIHQASPYALVVGGSMMYIDALCQGIDDIPDVDETVRREVYQRYELEGLEPILQELKVLDPAYYARVDRRNYKRVLHGYEVCLSTGKPFSSYHRHTPKERPWKTIKIGLTRERDELYERINRRVVKMVEQGLEEEARAVYHLRHLNALNTVGFKELFAYFDGETSREEAIRLIQRNTRTYARKQLTWWRRDTSIHWVTSEEEPSLQDIISLCR